MKNFAAFLFFFMIILPVAFSVTSEQCLENSGEGNCVKCLNSYGTGANTCGFCKSNNKCLVGSLYISGIDTYYPSPIEQCPEVDKNWVWWNDGRRDGNDRCPCIAPQSGKKLVVTATEGLNLRSTPGGSLIILMPFNSIVISKGECALKKYNGVDYIWYKINYNGEDGWAVSNWLSEVQETPISATTTTQSGYFQTTTTILTTTTIKSCSVGSCCGCHLKYDENCNCDIESLSCTSECKKNTCGKHQVTIPDGKSFYVNQDELIMCTYKNGQKVKEYPVSTGADRTMTDTNLLNGRHLEYYVRNQFFYKEWNCCADYVWSWGKGMFLIHGPPYTTPNSDKGDCSGEKRYISFYGWDGLEVAGNCRSSHGCIRLKPNDIKDFTDWVREGGGEPKDVVGFISDNPQSPDCKNVCPLKCQNPCPTECRSLQACKSKCLNLFSAVASLTVPEIVKKGTSLTTSFSGCSLGIAFIENSDELIVELIKGDKTIDTLPRGKNIKTNIICFDPPTEINKNTVII